LENWKRKKKGKHGGTPSPKYYMDEGWGGREGRLWTRPREMMGEIEEKMRKGGIYRARVSDQQRIYISSSSICI